MFNDFKDWVELTLGTVYLYSPGMWVESESSAEDRYCVIQSSGGAQVDVDDRRPRYRVVLLGRRNHREDHASLMGDADALVAATLGDLAVCNAAHVQAITEPVGPGYTEENRAWCQVDFEVTF